MVTALRGDDYPALATVVGNGGDRRRQTSKAPRLEPHAGKREAATAYARKQDAEAAIGAGYDQHLPKPVAPADLVKAIKAVTRVVA